MPNILKQPVKIILSGPIHYNLFNPKEQSLKNTLDEQCRKQVKYRKTRYQYLVTIRNKIYVKECVILC